MTEILLSVAPSVFSWIMLGRRSSSAAFMLLRPEKGVVWTIPRWTHLAWVAVIALMVRDLVSTSRNAATGRATWRHLSSTLRFVDEEAKKTLKSNDSSPDILAKLCSKKSQELLLKICYEILRSVKINPMQITMFGSRKWKSRLANLFARTIHILVASS